MSIQKTIIEPVNQPSDRIYSNRSGTKIISFEINQSLAYLLNKSIRFQGDFRIQQSGGTNATPLLPDNQGRKSGTAYDCKLNNRAGLSSMIQSISINSLKNHRNIETQRAYNYLQALMEPSLFSQEEADSHEQFDSLTASNQYSEGLLNNQQVSFSLRLKTGFLSGVQKFPLNFTGLRIDITLEDDSNCVFGGNAGDNAGAYIQVLEPELVYDLFIPPPDEQAEMEKSKGSVFSYDTIQHMYSTISSNNQTISLNLGTSKTQMVIHGFNDTASQYNYADDNFKNKKLTGLKRVSFQKNGSLFPRENAIECEDNVTQDVPITELVKTFMDAIVPEKQQVHSDVSVASQIGVLLNTNVFDTNLNYEYTPENASGIGVRCDPLSVGIDYSSSPYVVAIETEANQTSQQSMYSFVKHTNSLVFSNNTVQVIS